jgi:thioredoxin-related protein
MEIKVLKFSMEGCAPCVRLEKELEGFNITTVDIQKDSEIRKKYNIRNVPALIFEKNEKEIHRHIGFLPRQKFEDILREINDK